MLWSQLRAGTLVTFFSIATFTTALADQPIADTDAAAHVGEVATVEGLVVNVFVSSKGIVFLDFENKNPDEVFLGVVFTSPATQFGDLTTYQGKRVQITGQIRLWEGKPEIIVKSPYQLHLAP